MKVHIRKLQALQLLGDEVFSHSNPESKLNDQDREEVDEVLAKLGNAVSEVSKVLTAKFKKALIG